MKKANGSRLSGTVANRPGLRWRFRHIVELVCIAAATFAAQATINVAPLAAQFVCTCGADFDPWTNCIETKVERNYSDSNGACYNVIVFNHQSSAVTARCNAYNTEQYVTFALDTSCYNYRSMHLQITPVTLNYSYTPAIVRYWFNDTGTYYTAYNRTTLHLPKMTWQRRLNSDNSANYFARCTIDTFTVCVDCISPAADSTDSACASRLGLKVYFSNINGFPTCTDETGPPFGRNYDTVEVAPPYCDWDDRCGPCGGYGVPCNSWSVNYGCDYADIKFVNDHAYPICSTVTQISFRVNGILPCSTEALPQFRDWYSTRVGNLYIYVPRGTPLRPCDSFEIRLPFCCDTMPAAVSIELGQGFCDWDPDGYWDSDRVKSHEFTSMGCGSCFFDKDRGEMSRRKIDSTGQPVSGECDTLTLYNRNHSATADCGSDATGNQPWFAVEIDSLFPCTPQILQPSNWEFITPTPPSRKWRFQPNSPPKPMGQPIAGCGKLQVVFCDCDPWPYRGNKMFWTTFDATGNPISSDSLNGEDWGTGFPKQTVRQEPVRNWASFSALGLPMPNPSTGVVSIPLSVAPLASGDGTAHIVVVDASGRLTAKMSRNVHGGEVVNLELDGSGWPAGSYFVRVEIGGEKLSASFVVTR